MRSPLLPMLDHVTNDDGVSRANSAELLALRARFIAIGVLGSHRGHITPANGFDCACARQRPQRACSRVSRAEQPSRALRSPVRDGRHWIEKYLEAKDPAGVPAPRRFIARVKVWGLGLARGAFQKLALIISRGRAV
jgi:hypothetical protein